MTDDATRKHTRSLAVGVAVSALGFGLHNGVELGARGILSLENGFLLFVAAQLVMLALYPRRGRPMAGGLLASGIVQVLGGAILSILPLAFLPNDPPQTPSHYAMHAVLGLSQVPLIVAGWRAQSRRPPGS